MTPEEYCFEAYRTNTALKNLPASDLIHAAMGCVTEAGELMDAIKKNMFYNKPLDVINIREELGDILWYIAIAHWTMGWNLTDTMKTNIDKLKQRYPEKFTEDKALNRDLKAERKLLDESMGQHSP